MPHFIEIDDSTYSTGISNDLEDFVRTDRLVIHKLIDEQTLTGRNDSYRTYKVIVNNAMIDITITKGKDYYFYIEVKKNGIKANNYKCDEIIGLEECLKLLLNF